MAIDFKAMEDLLKARNVKKKFIPQNELITEEEMDTIRELIETYGEGEVFRLLETVRSTFKPRFIIELDCDNNCGNKHIIYLLRHEFIYYIKFYKISTMANIPFDGYICRDCCCKEFEQKEEDHRKREECWKETKKFITQHYIEYYLNPNNSLEKEIDTPKVWKEMSQTLDNNIIELENYIKSMNYHEFLKTPHWKVISLKKKQQSNYKCQLCNSNQSLSTHHRTYEIRGREHKYLDDLIVLCKQCHEKFHDINKPQDIEAQEVVSQSNNSIN